MNNLSISRCVNKMHRDFIANDSANATTQIGSIISEITARDVASESEGVERSADTVASNAEKIENMVSAFKI